jgi:hypothetical protein
VSLGDGIELCKSAYSPRTTAGRCTAAAEQNQETPKVLSANGGPEELLIWQENSLLTGPLGHNCALSGAGSHGLHGDCCGVWKVQGVWGIYSEQREFLAWR